MSRSLIITRFVASAIVRRLVLHRRAQALFSQHSRGISLANWLTLRIARSVLWGRSAPAAPPSTTSQSSSCPRRIFLPPPRSPLDARRSRDSLARKSRPLRPPPLTPAPFLPRPL